ncbi:MAG: branched-chain amino acid ABC transporter permease [Thermoproteota archaeon]|nr:branched-chain amino acid ABC transporter permease [Candidatus Brockarchaeota archaeon]
MIPGFVQTLINFIQYIFFYVVFSLPLTLSYRTTKVINFVHANFITYGAYVAIFLHGVLGSTSMLIAAILAFLIIGSIAVLDNVLVFTPLQRRGSSPAIVMISSMGLWITYRYLLYMLTDIMHFYTSKNFVSYGRITYSDVSTATIAGVNLSQSFIASMLAAILVVSFLCLMLEKTRMGRAIRAVSDNATLAEISGIPRNLVINLTWFVCGGITAVGGVLWTSFSGAITPEAGDSMVLQVFTIGFIGGLASLLRTGIGAVIIAFMENVGIAFLNAYLGVPVSFRPFLTFVALITTLILFPPLGAGGGLPYRFRKRRYS